MRKFHRPSIFVFILFFQQEDETADIIAFDVAVTGNIIMTCNNKNQLVIRNFKGEVLETVDTRHGDTYSATLSPCGRFIATTGKVHILFLLLILPHISVWLCHLTHY